MECIKCNKTFRNKWSLERHEKSRLHISGHVNYCCPACNFNSKDLGRLKQHILTKEHRRNELSNPFPEIKTLKNRLKRARQKKNIDKIKEAKSITLFINKVINPK